MNENEQSLVAWLENLASMVDKLGRKLDEVSKMPRTRGIEKLFDSLVEERARLFRMHESIIAHLSNVAQ